MWTLVVSLVFWTAAGEPRFAAVEQPWATEAQCLEARDWWTRHSEAAPAAYPGYVQLKAPDCYPDGGAEVS
jgi:hypothetical protein